MYSTQCNTDYGWLLKRIIVPVTGTCIFGDAATFINKDFRVLIGDIFIVPFLGSALGYLVAMCGPEWEKCGCNWPEWFARGQGIWRQIFEKREIPTPCPAPPRQLYLDRCIKLVYPVWNLSDSSKSRDDRQIKGIRRCRQSRFLFSDPILGKIGATLLAGYC